jgi:hypothetical protein
MYAVGTEILEHVRSGYMKIRKCAPRIQETTTTTTTTKSLHNSSRETLSEYLVNGISLNKFCQTYHQIREICTCKEQLHS